MTQTKMVDGNASPVQGAAWTDRERALMDAWDAENAPPPPDHDEAFEQRVLQACREIDQLSLDQLGDDDAATLLRIRIEAEEERACAEQECAQRNAAAFREIAVRHGDYLRMAALRLSGRRDLADDLVQETLRRALVHFDDFAPASNARAWLTTIMTNVHRDHIRHRLAGARAAQELENAPAFERDPDDRFLGISDAALWDAVQTLHADLRQVVELRYRAKLSYKEIARKLQLPGGTVATRLMRAHEHLLQRLRRPAA
jgi:RNA polymerase sigma-70 factor (ECF subfamily)